MDREHFPLEMAKVPEKATRYFSASPNLSRPGTQYGKLQMQHVKMRFSSYLLMRGRPAMAVLLLQRACPHLLEPLPPVSAPSTWATHNSALCPVTKRRQHRNYPQETKTTLSKSFCWSRHIRSHTAPMREDGETGGLLQIHRIPPHTWPDGFWGQC